jgi:hypothetical protein
MKKAAWLLIAPVIVVVVGRFGGNPAETSAVPAGVSYGAITNVAGGAAGLVDVQLHEIGFKGPAADSRTVDVPVLKKDQSFSPDEGGIPDRPNMLSGDDLEREIEQRMIRDRMKKSGGFLGTRDDRMDDEEGFTREINGGWGSGWLAEEIFNAEKSEILERKQREASEQVDSSWRDSYISGSSRGAGLSGAGRSAGSRAERITPGSSSIKIERWKIGGR